MRSVFLVCCAALLLQGCAGPATPVQIQGVQPTEESGVVGCRYLDTVSGSSGWYGVNAGLGLSNARAEALSQALALGANRVVWIPLAQGYGSTHATAKAYRCPE